MGYIIRESKFDSQWGVNIVHLLQGNGEKLLCLKNTERQKLVQQSWYFKMYVKGKVIPFTGLDRP
jgi:hypothetical protein